MSFFVLDASVWVARLVPQDAFHESVKSWMSNVRAAGTQFISPSLLLAEVAGAVSRRATAALTRQVLKDLEALPGLRLVEMDNATTFRDDSGFAHNAACSTAGTCPLAGHQGKYGNAPQFDGSND